MGVFLRGAVLAIAGLTAACVSVLPEQEVPSGLYRLADIDSNVELIANVVVREPTTARIFAGQGMVVQDSDGALRLISGVEWAGRPAQLLKGGLIDAFDINSDGTAVTDMSGAVGDYELSWRIKDLTIVERGNGGDAICGLSVTLLDGETRTPIASTGIERSVPVADSSAAARAAAISQSATNCVEAVADFVSRTVAKDYSAAEISPES